MPKEGFGKLSVPTTNFGVIPFLLNMPKEQLKQELSKTHPSTLAVKLIHYPDEDVAIIASALSPKQRKVLMDNLSLLRGEKVEKKKDKSLANKKLIASLFIKPFHLPYLTIFVSLILSMAAIFFSFGCIP